ncbi:hypothetical protein BV898_18530 [Hypsibius exemplaris]|uniref:Uncharacterized protein n=1 Tax=Hypsibius exemplaris TaxID=2072580 RepID=A0A9X6NK57_HYPEX|nr:hypothetical protein BV898_18530 [Hypsibius exemplaris]
MGGSTLPYGWVNPALWANLISRIDRQSFQQTVHLTDKLSTTRTDCSRFGRAVHCEHGPSIVLTVRPLFRQTVNLPDEPSTVGTNRLPFDLTVHQSDRLFTIRRVNIPAESGASAGNVDGPHRMKEWKLTTQQEFCSGKQVFEYTKPTKDFPSKIVYMKSPAESSFIHMPWKLQRHDA